MPVLTRTKYCTAQKFAEEWSVSRSFITKLVQEGMPHKYIGNRLRIPYEEAREWIDKKFNYK